MYRPGIDDPRRGPRAGWPRLAGVVDLEGLPGGPVGPAAKAAIDALLARYCWALDERAPDLLGKCFAAEAVLERRIEEQRELPRLVGREAIVSAHREAWEASPWGQTRRFLDAGLTGTRSEGSAVTLARLMMTRTTAAGTEVLGTGFELFELSGQGGRWEIQSLVSGFDGPQKFRFGG